MEIFRPDIYKKSIYDIDYVKLKKNGIKCILFDLDNTIASLDISVPDKKILDFFLYIEELGIKPIILSNASKKRVAPFKEKCNIDSSFRSRKPLKRKYLKILDMYNLSDIEVACVGDQILTDILGSNRVGLTSILVNPISKKEQFGTKVNRFFEKLICRRLKKRGLFEKGVYYE